MAKYPDGHALPAIPAMKRLGQPVESASNFAMSWDANSSAALRFFAANSVRLIRELYLDASRLRTVAEDIASHLNDAGVTTVTGRKFYLQTVKNYHLRVALRAVVRGAQAS